ncbi:ROK family transcriptional regulator [Vallitalea pronyensis]|uniref:ROK family transcriptional regulator n=1 Tax=Vallitalea pronyensis TaxID=1348613 RepID=A0A8J8MIW0_9FIRM|nr:ROK family transcriptional regulator [Vallitalea pronyensis]QUI22399.1 ROK family transcriptional regulator [Vallitalea pronyensis]
MIGVNAKEYGEMSEDMFLLKDIDRESIKMSNSKKILQCLYQENQLTKQEISKALGLSIPTVTHNVNTLIDEGYIAQAGVATSTGGRKPAVLQFLPDAKYSIGIDVTSHGYDMVLTNLKSEIKATKQVDFHYKNMNAFITHVREEMHAMLKEHAIAVEHVLGVGFSLRGTVNKEHRIFEVAPNTDIKSIDFNQYEAILETKIYIENEANAAAIAENALGIAKQMRNLVYLSINEGVGTGIVIRGYLYRGKNHRAGEFGHMMVNPHGPSCTCGNKGCLETYVSTKALEKACHDAYGIAISVDELFQRFQLKEPEAVRIVEQLIQYLAIGIKNIVNGLDPHYIVIGGSLSLYGDYFMSQLKEQVYNNNIFYKPSDHKIMLSSLKEKSSVLGAALLPLQELLYGSEKVI